MSRSQRIVASISAFSNAVHILGKSMCVVIGVGITVSILIGVFYRYVLNQPLLWPEEMARFFMIWLVFVGGSVATKSGTQFSFAFLVDALPEKLRRAVELLASLIALSFVILFLIAGIPALKTFYRFTSMGVQISLIWPAIGIYIGALMVMVHLFDDLLQRLYQAMFRKAEDNEK